MPPLPVVPATLKVKIGWNVGADVAAVTILHAKYTGGPPMPADTLALATDFHASIVSRFGALYNPTVALEYVEVTDLASSVGAQSTYTATHVGTRSGGPLAAATAVLVSWIIVRRYRGGKPRSYFPFFSDTDLASDLSWVSGSVTAMETAVQLFYDDLVTFTSGSTVITQLVQVSYYQGFTSVTNPITGRTKDVAKLRVGGPITDALVSLTVSPRPASQRRRNLQRA